MKNDEGYTPLQLYLGNSRYSQIPVTKEQVELLSTPGCFDDTTYGGDTPLHLYVSKKSILEVTKMLITPTNLNKTNKRGYTPLHAALDASASIYFSDDRNKLLLTKDEIIELLITPENILIKDKFGQLPRDIAFIRGTLFGPIIHLLFPSGKITGDFKCLEIGERNKTEFFMTKM